MTHTPGPWTWRVGSDGWDGKTVTLEGETETVLYGWGYDASGIGFGQDEPGMTAEQLAELPDARLIAAAPDLLSELRSLLVDYHLSHAGLGVEECPNPRCISAATLIAKAEGKV